MSDPRSNERFRKVVLDQMADGGESRQSTSAGFLIVPLFERADRTL
jgi:hypothetical protein